MWLKPAEYSVPILRPQLDGAVRSQCRVRSVKSPHYIVAMNGTWRHNICFVQMNSVCSGQFRSGATSVKSSQVCSNRSSSLSASAKQTVCLSWHTSLAG